MAIIVDFRELERNLPEFRHRLLTGRGITWEEYELVYWRAMAQESARQNRAPPPELKIATNPREEESSQLVL